MKIKPELRRAKDYYEHFIKVYIRSREHLEVFISQLDKFKDDEKQFMLEYWDIDQVGGCVEIVSEADYEEELEDMSKEELEEYALEEFNVDLDRRHNISTLIEEVIELKENKED